MLLSGPRNDHKVSGWHVVLHYLSDRADCVNYGGASRVGHELLEGRDHGTTALGIEGEREHVGMIGLEPSYCSICTNP